MHVMRAASKQLKQLKMHKPPALAPASLSSADLHFHDIYIDPELCPYFEAVNAANSALIDRKLSHFLVSCCLSFGIARLLVPAWADNCE